MASIVKRGKSFALVYEYIDNEGVKRQKWETHPTKKQALARKAEVESQINKGSFIPPSTVTVSGFLEDFAAVYGAKRWGLSTPPSRWSPRCSFYASAGGECRWPAGRRQWRAPPPPA